MKKIQHAAIAVLLVGAVSCGGSQTTEVATTETEAPAVEITNKVTGSYAIDLSQSIINWEGKKTVGESHTGTLALSNGKIDIAEGSITAGSFEVDMSSMKNTDLPEEKRAKLVGHLSTGDFFEVDKFPKANFVITSATAEKISGELTIKDKTETVSFPYTLNTKKEGITASGTLVFDRTKFGVTYASGNYFADLAKDRIIEDNISLDIKLVVAAQ